MFKSKGAIAGVAAALAASVLLVAGMAVTSTSGAATDVPGVPSGFPDPTNPDTGNPPAAEEVPATNPVPINPAGTAPGIDPTGGAGAGNAAPGALPNAGYGYSGSDGVSATVILLALAGAALVGVGAAAVSTRRS